MKPIIKIIRIFHGVGESAGPSINPHQDSQFGANFNFQVQTGSAAPSDPSLVALQGGLTSVDNDALQNLAQFNQSSATPRAPQLANHAPSEVSGIGRQPRLPGQIFLRRGYRPELF